jgi:hypothetical protein
MKKKIEVNRRALAYTKKGVDLEEQLLNITEWSKVRGQTVIVKFEYQNRAFNLVVDFAGVDVILPESIRLLVQSVGLCEEAEIDVVHEKDGFYRQDRRGQFVVTGTKSWVCAEERILSAYKELPTVRIGVGHVRVVPGGRSSQSRWEA